MFLVISLIVPKRMTWIESTIGFSYCVRLMRLNPTLDLIIHLDLSGMWLSVHLKTNTKKTCVLKEIWLHAQNLLIIPSVIVNIIEGDLYDHLMKMRIFASIMNKTWFGFDNCLTTIAFFILFDKWLQREKSTITTCLP